MSTELIINASLPETRIALMENGEIQDLLIERAEGKGIVGNIYKGRVTRVLPGMQAAFVDIGLEKAAFLYVDDVFVHSEIWEAEEGVANSANSEMAQIHTSGQAHAEHSETPATPGAEAHTGSTSTGASAPAHEAPPPFDEEAHAHDIHEDLRGDLEDEDDGEDDEEDDEGPVEMGNDPNDHDSGDLKGTVPPPFVDPGQSSESSGGSSAGSSESSPGSEGGAAAGPGDAQNPGGAEGFNRQKRHRRGRRGGKFRGRKGTERPERTDRNEPKVAAVSNQNYPENFNEHVAEEGDLVSDRSTLDQNDATAATIAEDAANRPGPAGSDSRAAPGEGSGGSGGHHSEFKSQRSRDRRIRPKNSMRPPRPQVNIQDLLKEGQEVLVQVAKDPIATKGARLTCHISLPGRHLVCMPTIDHVGVSRRIERDEERRKLREYVERYRPRGLGFIVRTASGKHQSEQRIKQDVDYLARLWSEIRDKAASVTAPALVYEDLNSVLRAIRDWVTEEIDKIVVDSRYHFNEIHRFVAHFMPSLKQKIELYHGDIPIFDAYNISTELSRGLERKVWLKSGGYLVIDQAEALVAIDVNTGRYVGKKNLEDTILKTNLEAVQEIAYQLRLRNCGGIIILDLIDMEKEENKHRVYRALEDALKHDRARPSILKISELGLVEMTRKRTRDTMVRALCESCTHCEGKGFIKAKTTVAYEVMREIEREGIDRDVSKIMVQANPDVIDILAIDERETLDHLERRYRKQIYLQAVIDMHPEQFEVISDKKERSERGKENNQVNERERDSQPQRGGGRNRQFQTRPQKTPAKNVERTPLTLPVPRDLAQVKAAQAAAAAAALAAGNPEGTLPTEGVDSANPAINPAEQTGNRVRPGGTPDDDGFYDEEDRLAFLRAQAAQDAALARANAAGADPASRGIRPSIAGPRNDGRSAAGPAGPGGPGGEGGRRGRRGRRGGRFRRNERPRPLGPDGQPLPGGEAPIGSEASRPVITPVVRTEAPKEAPSGGTSGDTGNNEGGGGDRSNPPAV